MDQVVIYPNIKSSQLSEVYIDTYQSPACITCWVLKLVRNLVSHFLVGLAHQETTSRQHPCYRQHSISHSSDCKLPDFLDKHTRIYFGEGKKNTIVQDTYPTSFPQCWAISYHTFNILAQLWNCKTNKPKFVSPKILHIFQVTEPSHLYTLRKEKTNKQKSKPHKYNNKIPLAHNAVGISLTLSLLLFSINHLSII